MVYPTFAEFSPKYSSKANISKSLFDWSFNLFMPDHLAQLYAPHTIPPLWPLAFQVLSFLFFCFFFFFYGLGFHRVVRLSRGVGFHVKFYNPIPPPVQPPCRFIFISTKLVAAPRRVLTSSRQMINMLSKNFVQVSVQNR